MNRKNNRIDLISGKLPPQALDLEAVVLGAIMLEKDAFEVAHEVLKHECFYKDANQIIFHAFENLYDRRLPIDILSVSEELKRMGRLEDVGGIGYIVGLTNDVISSAHIELHSKIIYEKYHRRQIIKLSMESMAHAYDESEDVFDVHDELEKNLANLGTFSLGSMTPIKKVVYDTFQQISEWKEDGNVVTGIPTGFKKLDFATRGWQRGDLIILAARPSVGKSSISLHFAEYAAESDKGAVCIFSLEMSAKDMVLRMIASNSEKELFDIQTGRLTDDELSDIFTNTGDYLASKNIFFEDSFDINVFSMRRKLKKIKKENGLSLVIIDYLQLMRDKSNNGKGDKNREREVAEFSRALKSLAKELDVPVMALSQLNRESGAKNITWNNGPTLAALRESGAIEQDADLVLMLWEPAQEECPPVANEHDPNDRKLGIKKQRNGRLVDIELRFEKNIQKMKSLENVNSIGTFKPF